MDYKAVRAENMAKARASLKPKSQIRAEHAVEIEKLRAEHKAEIERVLVDCEANIRVQEAKYNDEITQLTKENNFIYKELLKTQQLQQQQQQPQQSQAERMETLANNAYAEKLRNELYYKQRKAIMNDTFGGGIF
jgi:hypothetical protein